MTSFVDSLLCCVEGKLEIVAAVLGVQLTEVKGIWEEVMNEGTERHAIIPAGGEIGHLNILSDTQ